MRPWHATSSASDAMRLRSRLVQALLQPSRSVQSPQQRQGYLLLLGSQVPWPERLG